RQVRSVQDARKAPRALERGRRGVAGVGLRPADGAHQLCDARAAISAGKRCTAIGIDLDDALTGRRKDGGHDARVGLQLIAVLAALDDGAVEHVPREQAARDDVAAESLSYERDERRIEAASDELRQRRLRIGRRRLAERRVERGCRRQLSERVENGATRVERQNASHVPERGRRHVDAILRCR
ncbi:MAG TPA: hypothetical protein VF945_13630, partial [Polyangia bacterium]